MIGDTFLSSAHRSWIMRRTAVGVAIAVLVMTGVWNPAGRARAASLQAVAPASPMAQINVVLSGLAKKNLFMGSVLVAQNGRVELNRGYGYSNWEKHLPNTSNTTFRLADLSMQFTAAAILQLQEQGKLSVQDPAGQYLSDWPADWKDVTIRELLNHTSGVPDLYNDGVGFDDSKYSSPDQVIGLARNQKLLFKPGTEFHWSAIGYIALGLIIEKVSGQAYGDFLQQHIFGPLGMTQTGLGRDGVTVSGMARGYESVLRVKGFDPTSYFSAGDIYSTVNDLNKWDAALSAGTVVSKQVAQAMFTPSYTFQDKSAYGYAWQIATMKHHRLLINGGAMPGFTTLNAVFPDDGLTVVILSNNDRSALDVIFNYIAGQVLPKK